MPLEGHRLLAPSAHVPQPDRVVFGEPEANRPVWHQAIGKTFDSSQNARPRRAISFWRGGSPAPKRSRSRAAVENEAGRASPRKNAPDAATVAAPACPMKLRPGGPRQLPRVTGADAGQLTAASCR